ncbi:MAG: MarR family transcriptional regulator [Nocardioidaceae bacterium]|nr:MarR family transcriptional regulator [Nocardioidaceae bacterium]
MDVRWLSSDQQRAWRTYLLGTTLLMERLDRDLRERHDLSLPEYEILVRLSESADRRLRMAELADSVKNSRSRITHTIARMERGGLVVRRQCPSDGRGVFAHLTEAGRRKLEIAAPDHVRSVRDALIDVVAEDDLAAVSRAFAAVADTLETGAPDPVLSPKSA